MKLLGWMNRKLRQNINGDHVFKDVPTGPTCNCLSGGRSLDHHCHHHHQHHQQGPIHPVPLRIHSHPFKDSRVSSGEALLFEGLLSIGTLGSTPIKDYHDQYEYREQEEGEAHDFTFVLEAIAEKEETEAATEMDLMVVNTELEKVLTEVAEKEGDQRLSSARPSHVSGKANEACPLQEFLFGAMTEVAATVVEKEGVKGKRASLGELFMIDEGGRGEKEGKKKGEEMMKKKGIKRSKSHKAAIGGGGGGAGGSYSKDTVKPAKFQKILQIFHRIIHPEDEVASRKSTTRSSKYKNKCSSNCSGGSNCFAGNGRDPLMTSSKRSNNQPCGTLSLNGSDCTNGGEHWIKTDADYLVLELQNGNGISCTKDYYPKAVLVH